MSFNIMNRSSHAEVNTWASGAYIITALRVGQQIEFRADSMTSISPKINQVVYSKDFKVDNLDHLCCQLKEPNIQVRLSGIDDGNATVHINRLKDKHDVWFGQSNVALSEQIQRQLAAASVLSQVTVSTEWCVFNEDATFIEDGALAKRIEIKLLQSSKAIQLFDAFLSGFVGKQECPGMTSLEREDLERELSAINLSNEAVNLIAKKNKSLKELVIYISSIDPKDTMVHIKDIDNYEERILHNRGGKATSILAKAAVDFAWIAIKLKMTASMQQPL